ncbi:MAG: hypothetical protein WAR79_00365 [Melioribacteraceae bacterium]
MKNHLSIIDINDKRIIWSSSELASLLHYLKNEQKLLGLTFDNNTLKLIDYDELFSPNRFEDFNFNTTIILDRNLLIAARNFFNNRCAQDKVDRFFLMVLSYAMFTNSLIDYNISIYEGGNNKFISAIDDLKKIRVLDNLSLDIILKLLFGEIKKIPENEFKKAKQLTKQISEFLLRENYNKQLRLYKQTYPYFLKAASLLRDRNLSIKVKIKRFQSWIYDEYISMNIPIIIVMHSILNEENIMKNIFTNNKEKLLKNIRNATWDATILSYMREQCTKNHGHFFIMATYDIKLVEMMKYCFVADEEIDNTFNENKIEIKKIIEQNNKIIKSKNRKNVVEERLNKSDIITEALENELLNQI